MFVNLIQCLTLAVAINAPQEKQPQASGQTAPSAQQDARPRTVKFTVDPTGFPDNYAFRMELRAKVVVSDLEKVDRQMFIANGALDTSDDNIVCSVLSDTAHTWDISYSNGKSVTKTPLSVEYIFPAKLPIPEDVRIPVIRIEFEGELALLVDGEIDAKVPLKNVQRFSPRANYTFQIKNDGEEDGKPAIDINFLSDIQAPAPMEMSLQFNPDGSVKEAHDSNGNKINISNIRVIK